LQDRIKSIEILRHLKGF